MTTQHGEIYGRVVGWLVVSWDDKKWQEFRVPTTMDELAKQGDSFGGGHFFTIIKTASGIEFESPGANPGPMPMGTPIGTEMVCRYCRDCGAPMWFVYREPDSRVVVSDFECEDCHS